MYRGIALPPCLGSSQALIRRIKFRRSSPERRVGFPQIGRIPHVGVTTPTVAAIVAASRGDRDRAGMLSRASAFLSADAVLLGPGLTLQPRIVRDERSSCPPGAAFQLHRKEEGDERATPPSGPYPPADDSGAGVCGADV